MSDIKRIRSRASRPQPGDVVTIRPPTVPRGPGRVDPEKLRLWFGLTDKQFAKALGVPERHIRLWRNSGSRPAPQSAEGRMLAMLAEVRDLALELLGAESARIWLTNPAPAFGGRRIKQILAELGPEPVKHLLIAAKEGVYV